MTDRELFHDKTLAYSRWTYDGWVWCHVGITALSVVLMICAESFVYEVARDMVLRAILLSESRPTKPSSLEKFWT